MRKLVEEHAAALGCAGKLEYVRGNLSLLNNQSLIEWLRPAHRATVGDANTVSVGVVCTDGSLPAAEQVQLDRGQTPWIDVGTAAMSMMLAAHAVKLGACPVTSFSKPAVNIVLELPPSVEAEFIVQIGHPATHAVITERAPSLTSLGDLVRWETYRPARVSSKFDVQKDGSDESGG